MRLENKVAVITGAASGIGRASALKFAREGAKVLAADNNGGDNEETVRMITAAGGTATGIRVDVTESAAVQRMIDTALSSYGRLDIVFNNAGININGTILETDEEDFDRIFAVNVKGVFLGCKATIPIMKSQGGGVILNTASQLGTVGNLNQAVYPATKGAVIQMTRCLALDHATDNIRVNCVCPGPIDTAMFWGASAQHGGDVETHVAKYSARIPMGRLGRAEEMANVAAFLCSDEASFVTGAAILADGGWTAL